MFNLRKTEKKFELVLDHVVEACLEYARNYDVSRILAGVPAKEQPELVDRLTHLKSDEFFEERRELYQKIFKDTFMRNGRVIAPVPDGSKKHRFVMAGTYFDGKVDFFQGLFNKDKSIPPEIQHKFDLTNNKHAIVVDLRKIREYLPEYQKAMRDCYPHPGLVIRGELDAICQLMLSTAKLCGYNIIDYSSSHTQPVSKEEINVMKGIQREKSDESKAVGDGYKLYCVGVTADTDEILRTMEKFTPDGKSSVLKVEKALNDFAKPESFQKLMMNSENAYVVWDKGKLTTPSKDRFKTVAKSHKSELTISDRSLWGKFKEQSNVRLDPTIEAGVAR